MNQVTLIGRITHDLILRETSTGKHYVFFTVAVDEVFNGTRKANFINCVAWNRVAETTTQYVGKGSLVAVSGKIVTRKDNRDQFIMEVSANSVTFLESRGREYHNKTMSTIANNDVNSSTNQENNFNKTNETNIEQGLQNTESYDTEISFVNNSSLDSSDSDDEAIIWD